MAWQRGACSTSAMPSHLKAPSFTMTLPLARCRVTAPAGPVLPHPAPGRLVARGVGPPRPFTHSLQAVRRVCRAGSGPLDISEPFHAIQTTESVATNPVDYDAEAPSPRLLGFTFQDVRWFYGRVRGRGSLPDAEVRLPRHPHFPPVLFLDRRVHTPGSPRPPAGLSPSRLQVPLSSPHSYSRYTTT